MIFFTTFLNFQNFATIHLTQVIKRKPNFKIIENKNSHVKGEIHPFMTFQLSADLNFKCKILIRTDKIK